MNLKNKTLYHKDILMKPHEDLWDKIYGRTNKFKTQMQDSKFSRMESQHSKDWGVEIKLTISNEL
jgi:hypothetical protein